MFYRVKPRIKFPISPALARASLFRIPPMIESGWRRSRRRRAEMDDFDGS
jgi:hypothetical protein